MIRCRKAARRDNEKRNVRILSLVLAAFLVIVALRLYGDLEFTDYMCRTDLLLNDSAFDPSSIGSTTVTKLHVNGSETSTALTPSTSHAHWHPQDRGERFPSVDERVRLYMSTWYLPPCSKPDLSFHRNNSDSTPTIFIQEKARSQPLSISCEPRRDAVFSIHSKTLAKCVGVRSLPLLSYCNDLFDDFWDFSFDSNPPVLVLAGDIRSEKAMPKADIHSTPVLAKHRKAASIEAVHNATHTKNPSDCTDQRNHLYFDHSNKNDYDVPIPFPPIIWKLNTKRHFGKHLDIVRHTKILWQDKIPKAIWRGDPTGYGRNRVMQNGIHFPEATCNAMPRCLFVKKHVGSHVLDAGFTSIKGHEMEGWMEENGLKKKTLSVSEQLSFKILVSLEGNDVASGLKWKLMSNSVVLMPPPSRTSWAMEELLEPFVHYVPMAHDGSDAREMVAWIIANDEEAQKIAERATLFIEDMLFHSRAMKDEEAIKREIITRYRVHWASL